MKIRFSKINLGIGAVLLVLALPLAAYFYIQSTSFKDKLGDSLSSALGESVEFGSDLKVEGIYPRVSISVPSAKLRTAEGTDGLKRARLQNLKISVSPSVILSAGTEGDVEIRAESLSLINESGGNNSDQSETGATQSKASDSLADQLDAALDQLSLLDVRLQLTEATLFSRDKETGNTTHRLSNIEVVSRNDSVTAKADLHDEVDISQHVDILLGNIERTSSNGQQVINGLLDIELTSVSNEFEPHELNTQWEVAGDVARLDQLELRSSSTWLRGDASLNRLGQSIDFDANLELRQFEFSAESLKSAEEDKQQPAQQPNARLFTYELFEGDIPRQVSADINLDFGAVRMDGAPVLNGRLHVQLDDGILDVNSEELYVLGGASDLSLQVDNSLSQLMGLQLKFEVNDMQLERIRSLEQEDTILSRGEADIILALRGAGPSQGHIASSLNGYVIAAIDNAQIKQRYASAIDTGIVGWAINKVSLLAGARKDATSTAKLSDPLSIECASLRIYINDGKVEVSNGAIVEFSDNVLFSSGYIDLASEKLGFAFRTKGRSMFDWSAISIIKYMEIGGSLNNPVVTLNPKELAKQGVLSASSVAWGPLPSLVYSLAEAGVKNMQSSKCVPEIE